MQSKPKKSVKSLELGMQFLEEGKFKESTLEFEKSLSINSKNLEAEEMLNLLKTHNQIEELFLNSNYEEALSVIENLKGMTRFNTIADVVNAKHEEILAKQQLANEINSLSATIDDLINNNSFDAGISVITEYLLKDISEDQRQQLSELSDKVNTAKEAYNEEQKKLEEERKAEEERKRKEAESKKITTKAQASDVMNSYLKNTRGITVPYELVDNFDTTINGKNAFGFNPRSIQSTHTSSLGFYFVTVDSEIYEEDIITGQFIKRK